MKIGIIGNGYVGKATQLLKCSLIDTMYVYDIIPEKCIPIGMPFEKLSECDLIFISLPTPMTSEGVCHTDIISGCVNNLRRIINSDKTSIVLRSTVPPGTSENLGVYFMPEFLTERNWQHDFISCKNWIFGCDLSDTIFREKITRLFNQAHLEGTLKHNNLHFTTRREAELAKYVRNSFLALKVSFFNEIAQYADINNINFEEVRRLSTLDDRIGPSHSYVPGVDGMRGYGGTCLPKDTHCLLHEMLQCGMVSFIMQAMINRNELVDRPEKDWLGDAGRAVIY